MARPPNISSMHSAAAENGANERSPISQNSMPLQSCFVAQREHQADHRREARGDDNAVEQQIFAASSRRGHEPAQTPRGSRPRRLRPPPSRRSNRRGPINIAPRAATAAPPEIPSTYGSASEFRSKTCISTPARASRPPVLKAFRARGRRSSNITSRDHRIAAAQRRQDAVQTHGRWCRPKWRALSSTIASSDKIKSSLAGCISRVPSQAVGVFRVSRVGSARERLQGARRRPWWTPRTSRATPQTPLAEPTRRDRTDWPSFVVVASSLGSYPTSSAPPRLKANPFGRGHAEYSTTGSLSLARRPQAAHRL